MEGEEPIERRGLRDRVYDRILRLVLGDEFEPGERLGIDTIARRLQVSPTPVREALVQLERTGLVTREALKGYRVAPPLAPDQLAELFDARIMLESTAARLATPAGAGLLAELRAAQDQHLAAGERVIGSLAQGRNDLEFATDYFAADAEFHRVIFGHCGNRYITEMSEALGAQLHRMRQLALHGVTDVREAIAEHGAILEAFASGDPAAPEDAMRRHIENVRDRSLAAEDRADATP